MDALTKGLALLDILRGERRLKRAQFEQAAFFARRSRKNAARISEATRQQELRLRATVLEVKALLQSSRSQDAVAICRHARKTNSDVDLFFEMPCQHALDSSSALSKAECEDLACWLIRRNQESCLERSRVGERLHAEIRRGGPQSIRDWQPLIVRLMKRDVGPWYWLPLYLAECARLAGRLGDAERHLRHAQRLAPDSRCRNRICWMRAHTLSGLGRPDLAAALIKKLDRNALVVRTDEVRLLARVGHSLDDTEYVYEALGLDLAKRAGDGVVHGIARQRFLEHPGFASRLIPVLNDAVSRLDNGAVPLQLLVTTTIAAAVAQDADTMNNCLNMMDRQQDAQMLPDYLTVLWPLFGFRRASADIDERLHRNAHRDPRIGWCHGVLTLLKHVQDNQGHVSEELLKRVERTRLDGPALPTWVQLLRILKAHSLLRAKDFEKLFPLLKSWRSTARSQHAAFQGIADSALIACNIGEVLAHPYVPSLCSEAVVKHFARRELAVVCRRWNRGMVTEECTWESLARAVTLIDRLDRITGVFAVWAGFILGQAGRNDSAYRRWWGRMCREELTPEWRGKALLACWRPQSALWQQVAIDWLNHREDCDRWPPIRRAVACHAAAHGDWSTAAEALGIETESPMAVLRELEASNQQQELIRAWQEYRGGDFEAALPRAVGLLDACNNTQLVPDVIKIGIAALNGTAASSAQAPQTLVSRVEAAAEKAPELLREVPIDALMRCGAWLGAYSLLPGLKAPQEDLESGRLRIQALVCLEAAYRYCKSGSFQTASAAFWRAVSYWAVWMSKPSRIDGFLRRRLAAYEAGSVSTTKLDGRRLAEECFTAASERCRTSMDIAGGMWETLFQLEIVGASLSQEIPNGREEDSNTGLGPIGMGMSGSQAKALKQELLKRSEQECEKPVRSVHDLLRRVLGEMGDLETLEDAEDERSQQVERFFSPFGPAWLLLQKGQPVQALHYAESITSETPAHPVLSCARKFLMQLVPADNVSEWMNQKQMEVARTCHERIVESLVAVSPMDFAEIERALGTALGAVPAGPANEKLRESICNIAAGRANALCTKRTRAQRVSDDRDKRPNAQRYAEALDLLRLVWRFTGHRRIQGQLCTRLNQRGVMEANEKRFEAAEELLLEALSVKHNDPHVLKNLPTVMIASIVEWVEDEPEHSIQYYRRLRDRIDSMRKGTNDPATLAQVLDTLKERAEIPYFNRMNAALESNDLRWAHRYAMCCLEVFPEDEDLRKPLWLLVRKLEKEENQEPEYTGMIESLREKAPAKVFERPSAEEMLMELLRSSVSEDGEASRLNSEAVGAAKEKEFSRAIGLLERASTLDPGSEIIARNCREIAKAWLKYALHTGDMEEFITNDFVQRIIRDEISS